GLRSSDGRLVRTARSHILAGFEHTRVRIRRKAIAQGMPVDRLDLWFLPPAFFSQAGHGLRPAPGIPCALVVEEGEIEMQASGVIGRENESSCQNAAASAPSWISARDRNFACVIHQPVIASAATQSRVPHTTLDCFAALAMTAWRQQCVLLLYPVAAASDDQLSAGAAPPL
ncbi:hypothetical protein ACQR04_03505, partial [Bradyrhizobium oligotrophicum]